MVLHIENPFIVNHVAMRLERSKLPCTISSQGTIFILHGLFPMRRPKCLRIGYWHRLSGVLMCYLSQKACLVRVISGDVMTKVFDLAGVVAPGRICVK
jgi:hypothetical protein